MSSIWAKNLKISIFGESHGPSIGAVLDNIPAGEKINFDQIMFNMKRRAPGNSKITTPRKEDDIPKIISGVLNGCTTGAPICAIIENKNFNSSNYQNSELLRPGHADFSANVKYKGFNDSSGSGHLSGRLTAPITFCGSICRQILKNKNIFIGSHIYSIKNVYDEKFKTDVSKNLLENLSHEDFPTINLNVKDKMISTILDAKLKGDSVGGIVECAAINVPAGLGSPMFEGIENVISSLIFAIPAIKGIEFGSGFFGTTLLGSENNDPFVVYDNNIKTETNNHGGILGGITSGMPIVFRAAVKPTPSIATPQPTVNINNLSRQYISTTGWHDPCIVPRVLPVVESICAIAILDFIMEGHYHENK